MAPEQQIANTNASCTIAEVCRFLENWAPPAFAEDYDNVGLLVGNQNREVSRILVSLDATEQVVDEAIAQGSNLVVSHHPILFKGLKKLNGQSYIARTVEKAIRHDVGLYAIHTNLDNIQTGVNHKIGEKLGVKQMEILRPSRGKLLHLSVFVPFANQEAVLMALHQAGAGQLGNYKNCSFSAPGTGRFLPGENTTPAIGKPGSAETVDEMRIEVIFPNHLKTKILKALFDAHPYEEVAYFLSPLENEWSETGSGMVGLLNKPVPVADFIGQVKSAFGLAVVKHTQPRAEAVEKIAWCGGSGFFLLGDAKKAGADVYLTADIKYHEFFDAEGDLMLADIGHYESEQFTSECIVEQLSKQFPNIAVLLSKVRTNPVFYA